MRLYRPAEIHSVSQLTREIRLLLERGIGEVWVNGEISNFKTPGSGHWYFTLKDDGAALNSVMFRGNNRLLKFHPEDGMAIVARGRITVYEPRGQYQLIVEHMEPEGLGALQMAFEQLRERLAKEGLFDEDRKRPLPFLPRRIGIVTSISGAVVRDLCHVLYRRFPNVQTRIHPVRVQGEGAAEEIAAAVEGFSARQDVDLVIVARGGGSIEDLWAFNEEVVARAIAGCTVPVISAVGHETDFTIADFVADVRASTPSAAAELAVPVIDDLEARILALRSRLTRHTVGIVERGRLRVARLREVLEDPRLTLAGLRRRLDEVEQALIDAVEVPLRRNQRRVDDLYRRLWAESPRGRLSMFRSRVDGLSRVMLAAAPRYVSSRRDRLAALAGILDALSPLGVLSRGFSVVRLPDGTIVRRAAQAPIGTEIDVRVEQGRLGAMVTESEEP